jgi:elongation factor Ts
MITASLVKELREKSGAGMLDCKKALEATSGNIDEAMDWLREKGISKAAKKADRIAAEGIAAILEKGNTAAIVEVNSETDFVAKNEEFTDMVNTILNTIVDADVEDGNIEAVLALPCEDGTIENLIVNKTAKIGEKLSLRRFAKLTKTENENFGAYIHMGGKIAVLTLVEGASVEVAKDVSMHAAAMRPIYVTKEDVPTDVLEKERTVLKEQAMNEGKPAEIAAKMVEGRIRKYYEEVCLEEQAFVKDSDIKVSTFVSNNGGKIKNMIRYEVGEGMEKKNENFAEEVAKQMGN